jgi:hypothetical protein
MVRAREHGSGTEAERPCRDYRQLPAPVRLQDTVTSIEADPPPDFLAGRDPERDFMLRYSG